jgi:hypothetical protein
MREPPKAQLRHFAGMNADVSERGSELTVRFRISRETWLWKRCLGQKPGADCWFEEVRKVEVAPK